MNITLLLIATNKYTDFINQLVESADRYFLTNHNVSYLVFSNKEIKINTNRAVRFVQIEHEPWPSPTLKRYDYFLSQANQLQDQDYLYYSDVDMKFVDNVGEEILGERVATIHPGFWNKSIFEYTYERRENCNAFIPYGYGKRYYAGGFNGGSSYMEMCSTIVEWRKEDESRNIIPVWHDESYMNKYMALYPPTVQLSPSYCYPESWNLPFEKKLLALDKNHSEMRA